MDDAVQSYVDGIDPAFRSLFDQIHELVMAAHPEATMTLSYRMPTYKAGKRQLYVGAWQHGISLYGWGQGRDAGFAERHPELLGGRGTIRLRPRDATALADGELAALIRAVLD
jgi:uncharacterized protein YdhG (YjbR/CyaY superfamily)